MFCSFFFFLSSSPYSTVSDFNDNFDVTLNRKKTDQILQVIRISEFLKGYFNVAKYGIFPQFGSYLWNN